MWWWIVTVTNIPICIDMLRFRMLLRAPFLGQTHQAFQDAKEGVAQLKYSTNSRGIIAGTVQSSMVVHLGKVKFPQLQVPPKTTKVLPVYHRPMQNGASGAPFLDRPRFKQSNTSLLLQRLLCDSSRSCSFLVSCWNQCLATKISWKSHSRNISKQWIQWNHWKPTENLCSLGALNSISTILYSVLWL